MRWISLKKGGGIVKVLKIIVFVFYKILQTLNSFKIWNVKIYSKETFIFSHLADAFIQSDLQMRTIEAIKINKRAIVL